MIELDLPVFVKWAGGKTKLIPQFKKYFPNKINTYYEPFVGSGAVFFHIVQAHKPKKFNKLRYI